MASSSARVTVALEEGAHTTGALVEGAHATAVLVAEVRTTGGRSVGARVTGALVAGACKTDAREMRSRAMSVVSTLTCGIDEDVLSSHFADDIFNCGQKKTLVARTECFVPETRVFTLSN